MADTQQLMHDLEQRYVSLRREYDAVVVDRDQFKGMSLKWRLQYS